MKTHLAEMVDLTVRSITAYEAGEMIPSEETLEALARALRFPVAFFSGPDLDEPRSDSASFRSLSSMTAGQRDAALGAGALAVELSRWIEAEARFTLPVPDVPDLRGEAPEAAAEAVRAHWRLGEVPIRNMVHQIEARGVRVFSLAENSQDVDAFSFWKAGTPFVFLNTMKSAERSRFDAAHELGHLVLHRHGEPSGREAEQQADDFAAAFLMPKASILAAAPRLPSLDVLIKLKRNWSVSVAALAHRLHSLGLLSDWHYRTLCIEISQRGYRKNEPNGIQRETSQVLHKVFKALREEGWTKADVARQMQMPSSELDALVFGLVMVQLEGGRSEGGGRASAGKSKLRLV